MREWEVGEWEVGKWEGNIGEWRVAIDELERRSKASGKSVKSEIMCRGLLLVGTSIRCKEQPTGVPWLTPPALGFNIFQSYATHS